MEYYCPTCDKQMAEPVCPIHKTPNKRAEAISAVRSDRPPANRPKPAGESERKKDGAEPPRAEPPKPRERVGGTSADRPETGRVVPMVSRKPDGEKELGGGVESPRRPPSTGNMDASRQPETKTASTSTSAADRSSQPGTSSGGAQTSLVNPGSRRLLELYNKEGYEVYLIVGIGGAGKTEMLGTYRQSGYLDRIVRDATGGAMPTALAKFDCHPINVGSRKVVFVDASGEDFRLLYPKMQSTGEINKSHIEFLSLATQRLKGIVLLIELRRLWDVTRHQYPEDPANAEQVEILNWILSLVRWFKYDGQYTDELSSSISLKEQVNRSVMKMKKRLKIPVQVIFSKADEVKDFQIPPRLLSVGWVRRNAAPERRVYPAGERPLLFAYHCLPDLFEGVRNHADYFRFDFGHSLVTDPESGSISDPYPCGVTLSLKWLLDPVWQSRWPLISSRRLIGWKRFMDEHVWRNRRWRELPEPLEVKG